MKHRQYNPLGKDRFINIKIKWCKYCGEKSIHIFTRNAFYSIAVCFSGLFEIGIGLPDRVYRFKTGGLVIVSRGQ